jgi:hypothetical protein
MARWLVPVVVAVCAYFAWEQLVVERPVRHGPGVTAANAPVQRELGAAVPTFEKGGFRARALASFELEARVIRSKRYCCFGPDRLVPVDVVFGWGGMSDEAVLARLDISQSGRFYFWRYDGNPPLPRREIETSSANMHLIPATPAVEKRLKSLRPGQVVALKGYLVEVTGDGGFTWRSSLTREDTGAGACELIWVEELYAG